MIEFFDLKMLNSPTKTNRQLVGLSIFSGITYSGETENYIYETKSRYYSINTSDGNGYSYTDNIKYSSGITFTGKEYVGFETGITYNTGTTFTTGYTFNGMKDVTGVTHTTGYTHKLFFNYSGETYNWMIYKPLINQQSLNDYITENMSSYLSDIMRKEALWVLTPEAEKNTIVKPTIPDYIEQMADEGIDIQSIKRLLKLLTNTILTSSGITQQQIDDLSRIHDYYQVNKPYVTGEIFSFEGKLYEVIQSHTSQLDWLPSELPALYKVKTPAGTISEWVQPLGSEDSYHIGDKVTHNGHTWESTVDNNVWEPGVYGWDQLD